MEFTTITVEAARLRVAAHFKTRLIGYRIISNISFSLIYFTTLKDQIIEHRSKNKKNVPYLLAPAPFIEALTNANILYDPSVSTGGLSLITEAAKTFLPMSVNEENQIAGLLDRFIAFAENAVQEKCSVIIGKAILSAKEQRLSWKRLKEFITLNYPHFASSHSDWDVLIAHELRVQPYFMKTAIALKKTEKTKDFYSIKPGEEKRFENDESKKPVVKVEKSGKDSSVAPALSVPAPPSFSLLVTTAIEATITKKVTTQQVFESCQQHSTYSRVQISDVEHLLEQCKQFRWENDASGLKCWGLVDAGMEVPKVALKKDKNIPLPTAVSTRPIRSIPKRSLPHERYSTALESINEAILSNSGYPPLSHLEICNFITKTYPFFKSSAPEWKLTIETFLTEENFEKTEGITGVVRFGIKRKLNEMNLDGNEVSGGRVRPTPTQSSTSASGSNPRSTRKSRSNQNIPKLPQKAVPPPPKIFQPFPTIPVHLPQHFREGLMRNMKPLGPFGRARREEQAAVGGGVMAEGN